jgi:hypothetical protein
MTRSGISRAGQHRCRKDRDDLTEGSAVRARVLGVIFALFPCGCSSSSDACSTPQVYPVNESRVCLLPVVEARGLLACTGGVFGKAVEVACVADEEHHLYFAYLQNGTVLQSTQWRFSALFNEPSTLEQDEANRCLRIAEKIQFPGPAALCPR